MTSGQLLVVLACAAAILVAVAGLRRFDVPPPVVLVVGGLVIGFLPFVPDASLNPHVVLLGLLPLLVYEAAIAASPTAMLRNARSIGVLAVALVAVTAVAVAAVAHWLAGLSWPMAFVLGTAVGATDAAAATSIARGVGMPRRLRTTLEGEALFNDATALVLYGTAVTAATTGAFSVAHTVGEIVYAAVVGAAIGLAVGFVARRLRNRLDDSTLAIAGSILVAYAAYLPAEAIHASGVLAAVSAGLYLGWHSSSGAFSAGTRLQSEAFWHTLVFLVDAALFVLVGLSFHTFTAAATGPVGTLALTAAAVVATVMLLRLAWMWAFDWLLRSRAARGAGDREGDRRERLVLGWAGMRGAITLAALLAVPTATAAGEPLAGRDDVIYLGFAVIIATLLAQGLTLAPLVRRLHLSEHPAVAETERRARLELARATLRHLDRVSVSGGVDRRITAGLRAQYRARISHLEGTSRDRRRGVVAAPAVELALRDDITALQRRTLRRLRDEGAIGISTARALQRELDLQEAAMAARGRP